MMVCGRCAPKVLTLPIGVRLPQSEHPPAKDEAIPASNGGTLAYVAAALQRAVVAPVRAFRITYLPLLMVYFAYGALGLVAVAQGFWEKKGLTLSPTELAQLGVWLALPWAIKMVFGEMVDTVAIVGSPRSISCCTRSINSMYRST